MKLLTAQEWSTKYFGEDSRPAEVTVQRWLRNSEVPSKKIGGKWYVDEDAWLASERRVHAILTGRV